MKMMIAYLLILLGVSPLFGAPTSNFVTHEDKPDLSGIWVLDWSLTEPNGEKRMYDSLTMVITHHEPELRITYKGLKNKRETARHLVYYTDGREKKNGPVKSKPSIKPIFKWEGNILRSMQRIEFEQSGSFYFYEVADSWELSPNGTTLTHSTLRAETAQDMYGRKIGMGEYKDRYIKRVYKKTAP